MSRGDYVEGLAWFLPMLGSVTVASVLIVRRRLEGLSGAPRLLAFGLVFSALLLLVHILPGALGLLERWAVVVTALLVLAAALFVPAGLPYRVPAGDRSPAASSGALSWTIAALGGALVAGYVLASTLDSAGEPTTTADMMHFHLSNVARWIQSGSLWQVDQFLPDRAYGNYPHNGDIVLLAALLPWENDFLTRVTQLPWLVMFWGAVYALARELRAPTATATLAASTALAMPAVVSVALEGLPDTFMFATFTAGLLFLLRHWRSGERRDLVLAGVGLGLAFGTKWYAVYAVAIVVAVWGCCWLVDRRPVRALAGAGGGLVGLTLLTGGFWLIRNLVESGNPVFPVKISALGLTIFDAPVDIERERFGFTLGHHLLDGDMWRDHIIPDLDYYLGVGALAALVGLALAAALAVTRLRRPPPRGQSAGVVVALAACAALMVIAYVVTPYTAGGYEDKPILIAGNSRYVVPALAVGLALAAWAARESARLRPFLELALLVGLVDSIPEDIDSPAGWAVAIAVLVLAALALVAWLVRRGSLRLPARRTAVAAMAVGGVVLLAGAWELQQRYNGGRYVGVDPTIDWILANAASERRIALAGEGVGIVVYPAFGPRLDNEVEYVGPFVDEMLRPHTTRSGFVGALRGGGYDAVVVQLGGVHRPRNEGRQLRWLREEGYVQVARSKREVLFRAPDFATVSGRSRQ